MDSSYFTSLLPSDYHADSLRFDSGADFILG